MTLSEQILQDIKNNEEQAQRNATEKFLELATPYIPYKTGNLFNSISMVDNNTIEASADYAEEVLSPSAEPKQYSTEVHGKATSSALEVAFTENEEEILQVYAEELFKQ